MKCYQFTKRIDRDTMKFQEFMELICRLAAYYDSQTEQRKEISNQVHQFMEALWQAHSEVPAPESLRYRDIASKLQQRIQGSGTNGEEPIMLHG